MHVPVLLHEAIAGLEPKEGDVVIDATLGGAGHAKELSKRLGKKGTLLCIDADEAAIARGKKLLKGGNAKFLHGNFRALKALAEKAKLARVNGILFDLGVSSFHYESGRGFSFRRDEPLTMTFGAKKSMLFDARDIVNEWDESNLRDVIAGYGEERYAARIARGIITARERKPIAKSLELAAIIEASVPVAYRRRKIHPATKTFQALRMAVNDELASLREGLKGALAILSSGGRMAVISFHSLEDRIVKHFMKEGVVAGKLRLITKKPIVPGDAEVNENPRARSAKLRIAEKI